MTDDPIDELLAEAHRCDYSAGTNLVARLSTALRTLRAENRALRDDKERLELRGRRQDLIDAARSSAAGDPTR